MTALVFSTSSGRSTRPSDVRRLAPLLFAAWTLLLIQPASALLTESTRYLAQRIPAGAPWGKLASVQWVIAISVLTLVVPLAARALRPASALPALLVLCAAAMVGLAIGSGAVVDLLVVGALLSAFYELGRWLLERLGAWPEDRIEAACLSLAFGSGAFGLAALALGSLGLLRRPILVAVVGIPFLLFVRRAVRALADRGERVPPSVPSVVETVLWSLVATSLLVGYTVALAPEVQSDALRYHLALGRIYAASGTLPLIPEIVPSAWPMNAQVLYAAGMALQGMVTAKLLHTAAGIAAIISVGLLARRLAGPRAGLFAMALLGTLPVLTWELGTGYVDLFATWYAATAALCLLRWQETSARVWATLLGAAAGLAIASKMTAGFVVVGLLPALLIAGRGRFRALAAAAAGGLATLGPWIVRSAALTGTVPGLSLLVDALRPRPGGAAPPSLANLGGFGIGRSVAGLVRLPWEMTFHSALFGEILPGFLGLGLLLLLVPCLLLLRPTRPRMALAAVAVVSFALWFLTAQYHRYLLPTLALACPLLAAGFQELQEAASARRPRAAAVLPWVLALALAPSPLFFLAQEIAYPGELPVGLMLGRESREAYLTRMLPEYPVLERLDREAPPGAVVAVVPEGAQVYTHTLLRGVHTGAFWLISSRTPQELVENLFAHGMSLVVLNRNLIPADWHAPITDGALDQHAESVFSSGGVTLYRLRDPGAARLRPELLQNPGFEAAELGRPSSWTPVGEPRYDPGGTHAHGGTAAVLGGTAAGYYQTVQVHEGRPYTLAHYSRCEREGTYVRLQVNWLDAAGTQLDASLALRPGTAEYTRYTMQAEAPPGAIYANVYVSTHEDAPCWFDDYSFHAGRSSR